MNNELTTTNDPQGQYNGIVAVEQQRSIAEVQAAVIMARRFPRDMVQSINRIKMACQRPALAEVATYAYNRGGSDVTGPSIRLAEALAQNWGNLQFGIRELSQSNGESTVEAYAWDLETNVRQSKVFQVRHVRHTRQGSKQLTDPRDIYELAANNGARRLRACILGIIPGDVVEEAVEECNRTLTTKVDLNDKKIAKLVEAFASYGVSKAMIEERIQRPVDTLTPAMYVSLGKIGNSLKDGISKVGDWFRVEAPAVAEQPVRISPAQMAKAKSEIESGAATLEDVLAKLPNLASDQVDELRGVTKVEPLNTIAE